jgi:hypothetical protein
MTMWRYVTESEFAELLRVTLSTVQGWRQEGRIAAAEQAGYDTRYSFACADAFLRSIANDSRWAVTIAQLYIYELQHASPSLLTLDEAAIEADSTVDELSRLIRQHQFPAIVLQPHSDEDTENLGIRVPRDMLEHFRAPSPKDAVQVSCASRILGVGQLTMRSLLEGTLPEHALIPTCVPWNRSQQFVTNDSLLILLGQLLHNCTPRVWRAMRRDHDFETLLTLSDMIKRFGAPYATLKPAVAKWPCITMPGGTVKHYPLHLAKAWAEGVHVIPAPKPEPKVEEITQPPTHDPVPDVVAPPQPVPNGVTSTHLIEETFGLTPERLAEDIDSGILPTVKLDDGTRVIDAAHARAYQRRIEREVEPDYHVRLDEHW